MERLIIAATISFSLGVLGYVLFRFILMPVRRYGQIKSKICGVLSQALVTDRIPTGEKELIRKLAAALSDCYYDDLPVYYRLLLTRRHEQPIEACKMILAFTGIKQPGDVHRRAAEILSTLKCSRHIQN